MNLLAHHITFSGNLCSSCLFPMLLYPYGSEWIVCCTLLTILKFRGPPRGRQRFGVKKVDLMTNCYKITWLSDGKLHPSFVQLRKNQQRWVMYLRQ